MTSKAIEGMPTNPRFRNQVAGEQSERMDIWSFDVAKSKNEKTVEVSAPVYTPGTHRGNLSIYGKSEYDLKINVSPPGWFARLFPHYSFKTRIDRAWWKLYRKADKICIERQKRDELIRETLRLGETS